VGSGAEPKLQKHFCEFLVAKTLLIAAIFTTFVQERSVVIVAGAMTAQWALFPLPLWSWRPCYQIWFQLGAEALSIYKQ